MYRLALAKWKSISSDDFLSLAPDDWTWYSSLYPNSNPQQPTCMYANANQKKAKKKKKRVTQTCESWNGQSEHYYAFTFFWLLISLLCVYSGTLGEAFYGKGIYLYIYMSMDKVHIRPYRIQYIYIYVWMDVLGMLLGLFFSPTLPSTAFSSKDLV